MTEQGLARLKACMAVILFIWVSACANKPEVSNAERLQASNAELQDAISRLLKDEARSAEVVEVLKEGQNLTEQAEADYDQYVWRLKNLNADHNASREDFNQLLARMNANAAEHQEHALALNLRMKQLLSRDEWEQLASARKETIKAAFPSFR